MKIIKFEQKGCAPCKSVSTYLDGQGVDYTSLIVHEHIDIAVTYDVMSVPVTILLDDEGNEVKRSIGYKPSELEEIINLSK